MNIKRYSENLLQAAMDAGFTVSLYGEINGVGLPVLERREAGNLPEIYISAGVHGDEPAPPMAVCELLSKQLLPMGANYTIFPLINPDGLAAGTRENAAGIDLNRDYGPQPLSEETRLQLAWIGQRQFQLAFCLHEDFDGEGFYVYCHSRNPNGPDFSALAIAAAEPFTGVDKRSEIDGMPARDGRMYPPVEAIDRNREDLPESLRLHWHNATQVSMTTETPSTQPISQRIAAQCAVVEAVIGKFLGR